MSTVSVLCMRFVTLSICLAFMGVASGQASAQNPNWLRFYVGAQGGYAWEDLDLTGTPNDLLTQVESFEGEIGGFHAGGNFIQEGGIIGGIVSDFMWLNASDRGSTSATTSQTMFELCDDYKSSYYYDCEEPTTITTTTDLGISADVEWKSSVRAKAGFLITPDVLFYTTAGIAFAKVNVKATSKTTVVTNPPPPAPTMTTLRDSDSTILTGVVAGTGVEGFVAPDISAFVQVLYYDFQSTNLNLLGSRVNVDLQETIVVGGLSLYLN